MKNKELWIEITNKCNERCLHCAPESGVAYKNEFNITRLEEIVSEAKEMGFNELIVTGGEPFLVSKKTLKVIEIGGAEMKKTILTNGTVYKNEILRRLFPFKENTTLEISVFSSTAEKHDFITGCLGSFKKMIKSCSQYIKGGIKVKWTFVATGVNYSELEGVLKLAQKIGISKVGVSRLIRSGRAITNWEILALPYQNYHELIVEVNDLSLKYEKILKVSKSFFPQTSEEKATSVCKAAKSRLFIQANGDTLPCPAFKSLPDFLGDNVFDNSISSIWNESKSFIKVRNEEFIDDSNIGDRFESCKAQRIKSLKQNAS